MHFFWTISYKPASNIKQRALNISLPNKYHQALRKKKNTNYVVKIIQI